MSGEIAAALRTACDDLIKKAGGAYRDEYVEYLTGIKKRLEASGDLYKSVEKDAANSTKSIVGKSDTAGVKRTFDQMEHDGAGSLESEGKDVAAAGQKAGGNSSATTGSTDPVDVVSGQLLDSVIDVSFPGVLPLVLKRAYASGYEHGSLLGPGWSSTLGIRLLVDGGGRVRFLGDDAQCLDYGIVNQVAMRLGTAAYPRHGARWPLTVSASGQAWTVEDPWSGISYLFSGTEDRERLLLAIHDRSGNEIQIHRDDDGSPVLVEHSGGYRVRVDLAEVADGQRIAGYVLESDGEEDGLLTGFGYDADGRLEKVFDSARKPHLYEYDSRDRICAWTDRSGFRYPYRYDDAGRVVETGEPGGFKHSLIAYEPEDRLSRVTDATGHTTVYRYDRYRQVVSVTDPRGAETAFRRDPAGRVLSRTTALGRETAFQYDSDGNQARIDYPDGKSASLAYEGPGRMSAAELPDGATWRYTWDDRGNPLTETDPLGAVTSFAYDDRGAVTSVTDPAGAVQRYENNAAGLPVVAIDPFGGRTEIVRDQHGRVIAVRTPEGEVTTFQRDGEGRVVSQTGPDGSASSTEYDAAGNRVAATDPSGGRTAYEYGPFYVPVARTDPDGTRYAFAYDGELRLTSITGPTGLTWTYGYDENGLRTYEKDFDGLEQRYAFDEDGSLTARTDPDGEVTEYVRDAAGRVAELRAGTEVSRFGYDAAGRLARAENENATVTFTRDLLGRVVREESGGRAITRSYDLEGNLVARTTPSGAESRWDYDLGGAVQSLTAGSRTLSITRDSLGREILRQAGDFSLTQAYDQAGQISVQHVTGAGRTLQKRSYGYDADGIPNRITDLLQGTRQLELDRAGRIAGIVHVDGPQAGQAERYAYDPIGNVTPARQAAPDGTEDQHVTQGTRITRSGRTTYRYDARGRLAEKTLRTLSGQRQTWTYTWNSADRLTAVTRPDGQRWAYQYDALGRRIGKNRLTSDGAAADVTSFAWDGTVLVEQELTRVDGTSEVLTWDYEQDGYSPAVQRRSSPAVGGAVDSEFWAIVTDLVGTPQELVSANGTIDWTRQTSLWGRPFGEPGDSEQAALCPLGFPGQYHDPETGLFYNNQRYYDPATGYYLSPDPQGLDAAPHPQRYVSNPLLLSDPLGLTPFGPVGQKSEAELQADADLLNKAFGVNKDTDFAVNGHTVASYQDKSGVLSYTVSSSGTTEDVRNLADGLKYNRRSGKQFMSSGKTDAEQQILNGIRDKKIPEGGRIATSREPCKEFRPRRKKGQLIPAQRCTHRLADYVRKNKIQVVGKFAPYMSDWMAANKDVGYGEPL